MSRAIARSTRALLSRLRKSTRTMLSTTSVSAIAPSTRVTLTIRPSDPNLEIFSQQFESRNAAQERVDFWYGTNRLIDLKEWRRLSFILSEPTK